VFRFNVPPGWPDLGRGCSPPPGWQPDPAWPAAPYGWNFWTDDGVAATPGRCSNCSATIEPGWAACPVCGTSTNASATVDRWTRPPDGPSRATAIVGFLLAGCSTIAALIPAYFRHGNSLASDPQNLWFNLPAIATWLGAAVLLGFRRSAWLAVGLGIGTTVLWAPEYASDIAAVVRGTEPALGFWLGMFGLGAALSATAASLIIALRAGGSWLSVARPAPRLMLLGGGLGVAFLVGDAMPWQRSVLHATVNGSRATLHTDCCTILHEHSWALTADLVIVILAVLMPILAASWQPNLLGLGVTLGVALGLVGSTLSGLAALTQAPSPASFGATPAEVSADAITTSTQALPGLWVALVAVVALTSLAAWRALPRPTPVRTG
jgi:hypothetical protein